MRLPTHGALAARRLTWPRTVCGSQAKYQYALEKHDRPPLAPGVDMTVQGLFSAGANASAQAYAMPRIAVIGRGFPE